MKYLKLFWILVIVAGMVSCKKVPDTSELSSKFVVITSREKEADFASYKTYYLSDTISYITNQVGADTIITGPPARQITDAIKTQMASRGYTLVSRSGNPDLGLVTLAINQQNTGVVYPPGWWWGYPGYPGWCYWGCYPPYYPIYPTYYSYNIGDFVIETFDVKNAETNNNLREIWYSQSSGVLSSTESANITRTIDAINEAFEQSPYFRAN
jgi:hypothetical protein